MMERQQTDRRRIVTNTEHCICNGWLKQSTMEATEFYGKYSVIRSNTGSSAKLLRKTPKYHSNKLYFMCMCNTVNWNL